LDSEINGSAFTCVHIVCSGLSMSFKLRKWVLRSVVPQKNCQVMSPLLSQESFICVLHLTKIMEIPITKYSVFQISRSYGDCAFHLLANNQPCRWYALLCLWKCNL